MFSTRISSLLVLFGFLGVFASCDILSSGPCMEGSGEMKTEVRAVPAFTGIDMRLPGKVIISAAAKSAVSIESFQNLLPEISTEVTGKTLIIKSESCLEYSNEEATVHVTLPEAESITLQSSGEVKIVAVPSSKPLLLTLSGSGSISYAGDVSHLKVVHSSSGTIVLEGAAKKLESTLSGSGKVQGYYLYADTAVATLSGSGYQQVWVNKYLDGTVKGSGNLFYRGWPNTIITETSASGKVVNDN